MIAVFVAIFAATRSSDRLHRASDTAASAGARDSAIVVAIVPGPRAGTLELSWPRVTDAVQYRVEMAAADGQPLGALGPFADPNVTLASDSASGLAPRRELRVRVVAIGRDRIVAASAPTRVTLP